MDDYTHKNDEIDPQEVERLALMFILGYDDSCRLQNQKLAADLDDIVQETITSLISGTPDSEPKS